MYIISSKPFIHSWTATAGWEGWLHFFLSGVSAQSLDAVKRIDRLQELHSTYQSRLQSLRAAGRLPQTLDALFTRPIVSIRQVEVVLQIPYKSAQRYVEKLEEIGLLRKITAKVRSWLS